MSKYLLVELYEDSEEDEIREDVREMMGTDSVSCVHRLPPLRALTDDEYLRLLIGNPGVRILQ